MSETLVLKKDYLKTPTSISVLGALCAAQLLEYGKISLFIDPVDSSIRVESPRYSVLLSQIPEEQALSILVLTGSSDPELLEFLAYLQEGQTEMETNDK